MVRGARVLLEIELLDRIGLGPVRQPREEARHREPDVAESSDSRSERHAAYSGVVKIFVRSRGFASSCQVSICIVTGEAPAMNARGPPRRPCRSRPAVRRRAACDPRSSRPPGSRTARPPKLAVLLLVDALEDGALVPVRALVPLERLGHLGLGDVHHATFEHLVRSRCC